MWIAAYRGQFELSRALARRGLELCHEQLGVAGPYFPGVLGLVAFWSGDNASAIEQFAEADRLAASVDWREPTMRRWTGDYVEALLELGRIDHAMHVLDDWEAGAVRLGRAWVLAQVARCRGLVAAARGDVEQAAVLLEQAVVHHQQVSDPFGRARALLALGVVRRRKRQKRTARDAIGAALVEFERLGAANWVEKARSELGRIGGRTREEGLTSAERRVAALVAEGRTNREVAAVLFVGERTVETHLSHVYAKLGVRSRAELARTFRAEEQSSGGLTISR
jgi:DNA-binding CsgD family transcriptional regulator